MVLDFIFHQLHGATFSTLVLSIFILTIPLLLVIVQQYVNVSHDYRKYYSFPVIGHWATRTRRHFRWRGLRFEIEFSVPRFAVVPRASFYHQQPSHDALLNCYTRDSNDVLSEKLSPHVSFQPSYSTNEWRDSDWKWPKQYRLLETPRRARNLDVAESPDPAWFDANDKPWFLRSDLTVPEVSTFYPIAVSSFSSWMYLNRSNLHGLPY
jgi:hypothetical protein